VALRSQDADRETLPRQPGKLDDADDAGGILPPRITPSTRKHFEAHRDRSGTDGVAPKICPRRKRVMGWGGSARAGVVAAEREVSAVPVDDHDRRRGILDEPVGEAVGRLVVNVAGAWGEDNHIGRAECCHDLRKRIALKHSGRGDDVQ